MILPKTISVAGVVLWTIASIASASENIASSAFDTADEYTVRIRTVIEYGLGDDAIGASSGTGFMVDAERGWIVTNRHVVGESPSFVEVSPKDQSYREARKVYVDSYADIAIIEVEPDSFKHQAKLGCGLQPIHKGHPVGAYGHPWGFEYTGTQGVISGMTHLFGPEMLQTDAPINPGNSGGPLISLISGDVVGVNAAKISKEGVESLGFAVPIDEVCRILALLKAGKDPSPPNLGATFFDLEDNDEIIVAETYAPAVALGLEPNDEIVGAGLNLESVDGYHELITRLRGSLDDVRLKVRRNSELVELRGSLPAQHVRRGVAFAGLVFSSLNFQDASSVPLGHDIGIQGIVKGSRGSAIDFEFWDMISRVNGTKVQSLEHFYVLLSELEVGSPVTLDLLRPFEEKHFFGPARRTLVAETPVWLDNAGEQAGLGVRVGWEESSALESTSNTADTKDRLRKLLNDIKNPALAILDSERDDLDRRTRSLLTSLENNTTESLAAK